MELKTAVRCTGLIVATSAVIIGISALALISQPSNSVSVIYPAAGLVFAAIWLYGIRLLPIVPIVHFGLSYRVSHSLAVATSVVLIELTICLVLLFALKRAGVDRQLSRFRDITRFVSWSLIVTAVGGCGAVLGEMILEKHGASELLTDGLSFWLSDFVSILIFVPLVASWRKWPFTSSRQFKSWLVLSTALLLFGIGIAVAGATGATALFLLLPFVVFTAMVAGVAGAASSGTILLVILLLLQHAGAPLGFEPLMRTLFVGIAAATGYLLGVLWTEKEEGAIRLRFLARHDSLTGLFNRFELESRLSVLIASAPPSSNALLYLDLDQFKLVNDTCGHLLGDRMLQELGGVLRAAVPPTATIARLGGDEFACVLETSSKESALQTTTALHDAMASYRFRTEAMSFGVGVSIGVTFFPTPDGDTADSVLGRADVACYRAKEDGRNRSHVYLAGDESMLEWHSGIQRASQLEQALSSGHFQLYGQKIIDLNESDDGDGRSFHEVLLRLVDAGEVRSPAEFLPVAQRFGLMNQLDRWVLDASCAHLASLNNPKVRLSVNLSGSTLNEPSFYAHVAGIPDRYGVLPSQLCLEVTEGVMIHRLRQAVDAMRGLRKLGFDIALDDFGSGVASFAYLQELPVTFVKLDGRFVRDLLTDPASEVIIESLVKLAHLRGIECVAEWVESQAVINRLRSLGVRYAQGYFLDKPSPLSETLPAG